jgi:uncharacterized membrane protein YedE/YeeE
MDNTWLLGLLGGILIGISISIMLLFNGKITGISGIFYGFSVNHDKSFPWKTAFILGLLSAGFLLNFIYPQKLLGHVDSSLWVMGLAGFLVGYGTRLGNGCTSGHGVCGVSRFSWRSILATLSFITAGILTVTIARQIGIVTL